MSDYSFVFPGQGSQRPGMAKDFYDEFEVVRQMFDQASSAIETDLAGIIFADDDPKLNLTEYTQPAILTVEAAMMQVIQDRYGIVGNFFAGHSLGEYTALVAAGMIGFTDAVKIVRKRGSLMQSAVKEGDGAMAALIFENIESTGYRDIVKNHDADVANLNSTDQIVISGAKQSVESAADELKSSIDGMQAIFLNVSAPFHSRLMAPIEAEFQSFLESFQIDVSQAGKVLSNFSGTFHQPKTLIEYLVKQISGSVRWIDNMKELIAKKHQIIEVGPNRPLGKFFNSLGAQTQSVINLRGMNKAFDS